MGREDEYAVDATPLVSRWRRWGRWLRTGLLLVGLPAALVTLAHLNIHVASGVPFAAPRLVVPGVLGVVTGFLLVRELARKAEQARLVDSLAAAREHALELAAQREELLERAQGRIQQLQTEQTVSLIALGAVHDLRNLLVPVATGAELLREDPRLADEIAEQLEMAAERGQDLCERLLDARGGTGLTSESLEVGPLLEDAVRSAIVLSGRHVEMTWHLEPAVIDFDRDDFFQMIHNVVSNSVKACPSGLRLRVLGQKAEDGRYRFRIEDNGPGLPADFSLERRMVRRRGDSAQGFGLQVVMAIMRRNHGRFRLESVEAGGAVARFDVELASGALRE